MPCVPYNRPFGEMHRTFSLSLRVILFESSTAKTSDSRPMPKTPDPIPVICTRCARPFTLSPRAYARRVARYGRTLLCERCLTDGWLRLQPRRYAHILAREDEP